ncbi:merozoite surface protein 9 [Plasmodium knowlesi strain H]|uniref:Merozoite surface protein 9 n=5 Tax=Plasmodium knowlesi TaxID=5850 RepID=A0A5K1UX95_PLAKH|nr:merozoite surface protein 9 [Plasmodium knowlesi strain H]AAL78899.1 merozoite surface protein-9 precursor [Plasmodium knowlesi]OTN64062.1 Merozoite surface protein 9 [Plasmodium knowlesi]CAA9991075.1 merozoite surface protein 9 [Plasmodium knowlesi strain H]SBO20632.1 merozoite surface protein 9 [Plasmodium knowlesi strain H]SBO21042.1 merozoite surface protein 9 [Plasmodium knowlesi strain H]|eukprot:XP_002262357.1 merozoite surface protein-9 precursor [Plasmodium knowlesi strain H]
MRVSIIIFSFVVFLVKGHIAKSDDKKNFSKLFDANLVNNYEKLFKVIKCQYCLTQKKGAQNEKCKKIMKECKHLLKDGEYMTMLKDLMSDLKVGKNEHVYGPNTEELKKIINFLELHKQEIKKIKNMIDTIKNNKAILLINGGDNAMVHKLNKKMKSLKNGVEYIQKSQEAITKHLSENDDEVNNILPDMFHLKGTTNKNGNELIQLGNVTDTDGENNYELGNLGVEDVIKNSMKGLFKDGEGLMDVVKNTLMQEGGGIGGELVSLIEKGKEIGQKIVDIEGMITNKDGTANADGTTIEKLDHFKTELSSYEFLITSLKGIVLGKLKDILLRLLYKAYISYKTKKAKEFGEPVPSEVPEEEYLNELKKGGLELGIKILFNKLRYLLIVIKKKLFPKKFGNKEDKTKKGENKALPKSVTLESAKLNSNMLRGSVCEEDVSLMTSIDNMIEEIDFYEKEIYKGSHSGGVIKGMDYDLEDDENDEDEMTEQMVEEVADHITQDMIDEVAHHVLDNITHDMAHMEEIVQGLSGDVTQIKEIVQKVNVAVEKVKHIVETEETQKTVEPEQIEETQNTVEPEQTEETQKTVEPEQTEETQNTVEPEQIEETQKTVEPEQTEEAQKTVEPEQTEETQKTVEPEQTEETQKTVEPEQTEETQKTVEPEQTEETQKTVEPEQTEETQKTVEPEQTEETQNTVEPEPTQETQNTVEP